ncbi:DNA repair protein RecO [Miltoncostaea marina]|uniref:DNA repair protein RecO n=1 Tax=Miltoncostaea marina TaxID=2843215 RepID=UPI001C3DE411|nr:DNA repair protein RecO [Miltoncostaea marina]
MGTYDTEAIVLRSIRYSEADAVLALSTRARGRVSAIAKGARRTSSRLGGRLQPGVRALVTVHEGRGDLGTIRSAAVLDAHAGLWVAGHRLQSAGCVLETVMKVMPEGEPSEEAWNLLVRALGLLARAPAPPGPARLDPLVLGVQAKLLVVSGLLPVLTACARCGAGPPLPAFSAAAGGTVCAACGAGADPVEPAALAAFAGLVGRPLAEAPEAVPPPAAAGVERLVGLVLREHLGVRLRSAAPL